MNLSQILVVSGLIFEFLSVFVVVRKLFYGYYKRLEEKGATFQQRMRKDRIEGYIVILLLVLGMALQALSVFIEDITTMI